MILDYKGDFGRKKSVCNFKIKFFVLFYELFFIFLVFNYIYFYLNV